MASNDMNSWDKDPDERLRQDWQQAFTTYKVQSEPSLRRRILRRAMARFRPQPMGWVAGGVLLLLMGTVLLYSIRRSNRPAWVATGGPVATQASDRANAGQVARPPKLARPVEQADSGPGAQGAGISPPLLDRYVSVPGIETAVVDGSSRHSRRLTHRPSLHAAWTSPLAKLSRRGRSLGQSSRFAGPRFSVTYSPSVEADHRPVAGSRVEPVGTPAGALREAPPVRSSQPVILAWPVARLDHSTLLALPSFLRGLPDRLPGPESATPPADRAENRVSRGKQWFVEAVPLSSFQWMSASSTSTGYLTQVQAPSAFSPATWGYQLNGGVRWQRWQAYLSLGQLRRWAYYTLNEDQYRMEPSPTSAYQMVQEKRVVVENVALPMVGGGLGQYRELGQGRYVVELDGQLTYAPLNGPMLASLRTSASRRLDLSHQLGLQAGLMAEYGLTRLKSEQQQLTIHPFVVGISIRIQPRRYSSDR